MNKKHLITELKKHREILEKALLSVARLEEIVRLYGEPDPSHQLVNLGLLDVDPETVKAP